LDAPSRGKASAADKSLVFADANALLLVSMVAK